MVAWYWLIVAFISGIVAAAITWNLVEWDSLVSDVFAVIASPFVYVGMFPVSFFRWFVKPINAEKWVKVVSGSPADKYWKIGRNTYLWHDPNAKKLFNKFFLIRVKRLDK